LFKSAKKLKFEINDTTGASAIGNDESTPFSEVVPFKLNAQNSFMNSNNNIFEPVDEEMTEDDNECRTPSMMMGGNNHQFT
jgi:hypothetical protein